MKYLIPLLFLLSCGPQHKSQAEITVMYNQVVESYSHPDYNTEFEMNKALNDDIKPDFIIFSASWCGACIDLKHVLNNLGWRSRVIVLNLEENWVRFIANTLGISSIPAMIVDNDNGNTISPIYVGPGEIGKVLYKHLEKKK